MTLNRPHWADLRPWQTNAALLVFGVGLMALTRQLIVENDGFVIGLDAVSSGSLALYLGAVFVLMLRPANTNRYTFGIILGVAIACRLITLFPDPFLSSDVYRYAWDGVVQHAGVNPYRYVPGDVALQNLREPNSDLFANMNRRDYAHTIYPPVAQIVFFLVTALNGSVAMMKCAMVLFEGLTMTGLVLLLREMGLRCEWTLLYAWHPLLIWEIGGSGHLDSVVMAFMVLALLFRSRRNAWLTGLFLGLAVLTKFYPIVLFPALYARRADGKLDWRMPAVMGGLAVATYSLYLSVGKGVFGFFGGYVREEGIETGTRWFLLEAMQRLPGLHSLPNGVFVVLACAVLACLALWSWRRATPLQAKPDAFLAPVLAFAFALMLLFSPHYPWYVAWLIPLVVLVPSLTVTVYVGALFYLCTTGWAVGYGPKQFHLNVLLYSAVAIAAVLETGLRRLPQTRTFFGRRLLGSGA